jgi:hypothetical protein
LDRVADLADSCLQGARGERGLGFTGGELLELALDRLARRPEQHAPVCERGLEGGVEEVVDDDARAAGLELNPGPSQPAPSHLFLLRPVRCIENERDL